MPAVLTYPGVYVDEVPTGGARPIAAVPTSIAVFIGPVPRGPMGVVHITGLDDFERNYGRVDPLNPLGVAVYQFFLNGGAEAKVVRVVPGGNGNGAKASTLRLSKAADDATAPLLTAASVGKWGDSLRARVDTIADDFDPQEPDKSKLYNLTVHDIGAKVTEHFTSINSDKNATRTVGAAIAGSKLVTLAKPDDAGTAVPKVNADPEKAGQDPFDDKTKPKSAGSSCGRRRRWWRWRWRCSSAGSGRALLRRGRRKRRQLRVARLGVGIRRPAHSPRRLQHRVPASRKSR